MQSKVALIILDGWGIAENPKVSAIQAANTPFFDQAISQYPNIKLQASELPVGLPEGQMGNSEVGHMNIGAGRIVYQDLVRLNKEFESGAFLDKTEVQELISYCRNKNKPVHIMGLLSDGGVHSSLAHLLGILKSFAKVDLPEIYIHCFMDGRDTSPTGGKEYIRQLEEGIKEHGAGKIASLIGRYYAMDRDKRWERVRKAYDLLIHGKGKAFTSAQEAIESSYSEDVTDEFVEPVVIVENDEPVATIKEEDAILFFNFRTDRGRQLTQVLSQTEIPEQEMKPIPLYYVTMTRYDATFEGVHVLYEKESIQNGLGEYLSNQGKTQVRIAETEKYPHVTFFFNGGREEPMEGEKHLLCPSPKVATYDLKPEMSAADIRDKIIEEIKASEPDFICLNFANPDMVGHTGVFDAVVKACETVDQCARSVVETLQEHGYVSLITADHGNADKMSNPDGSPHTAHTTSLVPFILIDPKNRLALADKLGKLGDIAPTVLTIMGLDIPKEMSGEVLCEPVRV